MSAPPRFHLAIPVHDLESARDFYLYTLGCRVGREGGRWIDFDFFGHQVTAHLVDDNAEKVATNPVDGENVPVRHFGVILAWEVWHALCRRLEVAKVEFLIPPTIRFRGRSGEQATFFLRDPSGNPIECKSFQDPEAVFRR